MTGWYDFSNVKSSKVLSFDSVAETHLPWPFGQKFQSCLLASHLPGRSTHHNSRKSSTSDVDEVGGS